MASEHDILSRLPEAPTPAPDARHDAIANALERFDKKSRAIPQGSAHDLRLMQQTASSIPPSRRSPTMPRARNVIAASVAVLVAGSAIGLYVHKTPGDFEIVDYKQTSRRSRIVWRRPRRRRRLQERMLRKIYAPGPRSWRPNALTRHKGARGEERCAVT
jgi:hypothetical protein